MNLFITLLENVNKSRTSANNVSVTNILKLKKGIVNTSKLSLTHNPAGIKIKNTQKK
jgi:hypothetical protein